MHEGTVSLLPASSGPFTRALEAAVTDVLDVDAIRRSRDPWLCSPSILPFLAHHRSVDLWDESWPIERKRWVVANWPRIERLKGTRAGLTEILRIVGVETARIIAPPAKTFLSPASTPEERAAYLSRFPQLRTYPFVQNGQAKFGTYTGKGGSGLRKSFFGMLHPADLATRQRFRRDVKLFEPRDGTLTDLASRVVVRHDIRGKTTEFVMVVLPASKSAAIHLGQNPKARLFFSRSAAAERLVAVSVDRPFGYAIGQTQYRTVSPGLSPINVDPELVAERGQRVAGQLFPGVGQPIEGTPPASSAWRRMFERTFLHDPARVPEARRSFVHVGRTRLGMPPHHAEAQVAIRSKRPLLATGRFVSGFTVAASQRPLQATREAALVAKRASDRIALKTKTRRVLRAGDHIIAGETRIGAIVAA